MITKYYNKLIKRKMFSKTLIIYALGIILVLSTFGIYLYFTILNITEKNEIRFISRTIQDVNKRINDKYVTFQTLLFQTYLDSFNNVSIDNFLEGKYDDSSAQGIYTKRNFSNYMTSMLSRDPDLYEISIYRKKDDKFYYFTRSGEGLFDRSQMVTPWLENTLNAKGVLTVLLPLSPSTYRPSYSVFRIGRNIKMLNSTLNLGVFVLGFKTDGLASDVSVMTKQVEGTILVLLSDNQVVYDSSGQYINKQNLILDQTKDLPNLTDSRYAGDDVNIQEVRGEDLFVFSSSKNSAGMQVIGLIPRHEMTKYADSIRSSIIAIDAICIAMLLVLITFNTSVLSKRVSVIKTAMKKLRGGDLSVRVSVSPEPDELGEIALSFNKMGDSLQEYIDKAYLFELRRRNAEYKYLQSQINPHFLYNTLEAIRMKAITAGDATSGQMIYKLALLMRSTIKQDAFITVSDEIEYCGMYLDLIKVRYGDKLDFVINVEPEVMKLGMPRHLLQPVLENSIVHGFGSGQKRLECSINACIRGDDLVITIKDNGCGMDKETIERLRLMLRSGSEEGSSIGLVNVSERIRILYGPNCGIELYSQSGQGTCVAIRIKALTIKEVSLLVQSTDR